MATDFALPENYRKLPLRALNSSARTKLAQYLDLDGELIADTDGRDIVNNYSGLAELIGFRHIEILNFMRCRRPTMELLNAWTIKDPNATIGKLWDYLYQMERLDVIADCHRVVVRNAEAFIEQELDQDEFPIQVPEVSNSHVDKEMEIDDLEGAVLDDIRFGTKTQFDAFVSYSETPEDVGFVRKMIQELEDKHKLKLFIPGRNDTPGAAQYVVTAEMIEKRCRRVIIVISKNFGKSFMCDFQVKFAQALSPGARSKRLIPVVIEKSPIPRILKFLSVCDFTRDDIDDWAWERLYLAVQAPLPQATSASMTNEFEGPLEQSKAESLGKIRMDISGIYSSFRQSRNSRDVKQLSRQSHSQPTSVEKSSESPSQEMRLDISKDSLQQRQNSNSVTQFTTQPFLPTVCDPKSTQDSISQSGAINRPRKEPEEKWEPSTISRLPMETAPLGDRDETISSSEDVYYI